MKSLGTEDRIKHILGRRDVGASVAVHGWIRTRRDSKGGFSFVEVNDGSTLAGIQVVADASLPNYESEILHLVTGCGINIARQYRTIERVYKNGISEHSG